MKKKEFQFFFWFEVYLFEWQSLIKRERETIFGWEKKLCLWNWDEGWMRVIVWVKSGVNLVNTLCIPFKKPQIQHKNKKNEEKNRVQVLRFSVKEIAFVRLEFDTNIFHRYSHSKSWIMLQWIYLFLSNVDCVKNRKKTFHMTWMCVRCCVVCVSV